jgi:hypothetical protein
MIPRHVLNGSAGYLPALAALVIVGAVVRIADVRRGLFLAAGLFIVSLAFRSVDNMACTAWPLGTHFVWHCLNGLLIYWLLRLAIRTSPLRI